LFADSKTLPPHAEGWRTGEACKVTAHFDDAIDIHHINKTPLTARTTASSAIARHPK